MDPASSIAGLLGLIGLALQAASGLHEFCLHFRNAPTEAEEIANDILGLQKILEHVRGLPLDVCRASTLTMLRDEILDCTVQLDTWLQKAKDGDPTPLKGVKRLGKRTSTAFGYHQFAELRSKVASHRAQLNLILDVVGR